MALVPNSRKDLGPLHQLLLRACPPGPKAGDAGSIKATLAPALGVCHQYLYRWIESNRIPAKFAKELVTISNDRITLDEVLPFVL